MAIGKQISSISRNTMRGFKWILTVVDVFSKYLWAQPLKNKSAEEVKEAFSHIFKERRPIVLQTDNGKEFKNTVSANYLHLWGITQVFSKLIHQLLKE